MRKSVQILAMVLICGMAMNMSACNGGEEEGDNKLTATPKTITFASSDAESQTVQVKSTGAWTAETNADWIKITPASTNGDGSIAVTVETGTEARSGSISVESGALSEIVTVTQTAPDATTPATGVKLNEVSRTMEIDDEFTLVATVLPEGASNTKVTWSSSDNKVASVDDNGLVKALAAGPSTITATTVDGGHEAECQITVNKAIINVERVELNESALELQMGETETATLTATLFPAEADDQTVTWGSSDDSVASITQNGLICTITALKEGTTTITVTSTDGGHETKCEVTVLKKELLPPPDAKTTTMWNIGAQTWSDVINVSACNKTTFDGSGPDCRNSNSADYGFFYSYQYVIDNAASMCPEPWSIPTIDDFIALDKALGGTGEEQKNNTVRDAYLNTWGGQYGGYGSKYGIYTQGAQGSYWSMTDAGTYANMLFIDNSGNVGPQRTSTKDSGRTVRCVAK